MTGPTTLAELSVAQFETLVDADIYPHGPCSSCRKSRPVKVWGSEGWRWSARCDECETLVPPEYVTFITAFQLHILIDHDGDDGSETDPSKPN